MPTRASWRSLVPGLAALAVLVLIMVVVVMFAGIGRIRGATTHLYVLTSQARGVMRGTEVWVAGQKVGVVDGVDFRPQSDDTLGRVVISITVRRRDVEQIRRDSRAQIRSGANIIGPVVVYLTSGSPDHPVVQPGDTIHASSQSDFAAMGPKLDSMRAQAGPIMTDGRAAIASLHDPNGTVGAFLTRGLGANAARLRAQIARLRARFGSGGGTLDGQADGEVAGVATLSDRTRATMARVDSIRTLLASPGTSLGRFRRDSSLGGSVARIRDELASLRESLSRQNGALARMQMDSALTLSIANAQHEMSALYTDIRRRPLRYVQF